MGTAFGAIPIRIGNSLVYVSYFPARPKLLPSPVTKSHPCFAVNLPAVPEVMSRKSELVQVLAPLPQLL